MTLHALLESMGVVVTLKSKMATSSASSEGNSKSTGSSRPIWKLKQIAELLLDGPATSEHMSTSITTI